MLKTIIYTLQISLLRKIIEGRRIGNSCCSSAECSVMISHKTYFLLRFGLINDTTFKFKHALKGLNELQLTL